MQTAPATRLAIDLMCDNNVQHVDFKFNRSKSALGYTKFQRDLISGNPYAIEISLSKVFLPFLSDGQVRNIMLHEIAHAIAGYEAAHNWQWRKVCLDIGGDGNAKDHSVPRHILQSIRKYRIVCPVDKKVLKYADRKTNTVWRCSVHKAEAVWLTQN